MNRLPDDVLANSANFERRAQKRKLDRKKPASPKKPKRGKVSGQPRNATENEIRQNSNVRVSNQNATNATEKVYSSETPKKGVGTMRDDILANSAYFERKLQGGRRGKKKTVTEGEASKENLHESIIEHATAEKTQKVNRKSEVEVRPRQDICDVTMTHENKDDDEVRGSLRTHTSLVADKLSTSVRLERKPRRGRPPKRRTTSPVKTTQLQPEDRPPTRITRRSTLLASLTSSSSQESTELTTLGRTRSKSRQVKQPSNEICDESLQKQQQKPQEPPSTSKRAARNRKKRENIDVEEITTETSQECAAPAKPKQQQQPKLLQQEGGSSPTTRPKRKARRKAKGAVTVVQSQDEVIEPPPKLDNFAKDWSNEEVEFLNK